MKNISTHNSELDYTEKKPRFGLPHISLIYDELEIDDIKYDNIDLSHYKYFTTEIIDDGTISVSIDSTIGTDMIKSISYSIDDGNTWTKTNNTDDKQNNLTITVNVHANDKVLWKGDAQQLSKQNKIKSFFSSTCYFNVSGNIMSLLYEDDFNDKYTLEHNYQFYCLFYNCKIVNAEHLILPATTLIQSCYSNMFRGCTSLTTAPALPATTLANYCYIHMFWDCTSLTSAPELPATTLAQYCYDSMFYRCTSLTTAPELPATTLASNCYYWMFYGCTSLTTAPTLPATTLARSCYGNMFKGCTSLTVAPELPATTLTTSCYYYMFEGCISLTTAPELHATTLVQSCYSNMFNGCTSLTTAPNLPATTLVESCYSNMFNGCTKLNYIKAMFTTTPSTTYTNNWVQNVASSGKFVKNNAATWNVSGISGIPTGWTVQTDYPFNTPYLTFTALEPGTFTFTISSNVTTNDLNFIEYSTDNGETWTRTNNIDNQDVTITTPQVTAGSTVMWRGVGNRISTSTSYYSRFSSSGRYNVSGKVNSLTTNNTNTLFCYLFNGCKVVDAKHLILSATTLANYCYTHMFWDCTSLTSAPELPATTLAQYCYDSMFYRCTSLTTAPELPTTNLALGCYYSMFTGCDSLNVAPELPATTLARDCYRSMFQSCTSLTTAPALPATTMATYCYYWMFQGCTSLTTAPELPATTLAEGCYSSMFYGCTSLTTAPELPATTLAYNCYRSMFYGCTSLTTAPMLPATTLADSCYRGMFQSCTSLTTAPALPATTLANYCYNDMFENCTSLTTAPELTVTALADYCYSSMLQNCTSLTTAPELPATTLASNCYQNMFYGCTSLTTAPELLPAMTLASNCYQNMFYGCTSLIAAPELPATTLVQGCYSGMFFGCTSLCFIKALFTNTPSNEYTNSWVYNVASKGTFIGDPQAEWVVIGINAIPNGWVHNMHEKVELMSIWIDDFYKTKHFDESTEEFDGEPIMTVINRAINDNQYHQGANKFTYYGQTLELDNHTYYLWEMNQFNNNAPYSDNLKYMLTDTDDYDTLNRQSLMYTEDYTQMFTSLVAFLNSDKTLSYERNDKTVDVQQLLLVERPKTPIMGAWIDDYAGYLQIHDALENPRSSGCPQYFYTGNTMQYNGETCYIWQTEYDKGEPYYILTNTIDYNTLYSQSLDSTRTPVQFTSMTGMLNDDSSVRYEEGDDTFDTTVLVRIDNSSSPMKMWVDDFYTLPDMDLVDELDDDTKSSAANSLNANLYVYYGDTIEYDGNEYYLWKYNEDGGAPDYLLTTSNDYDDLYDASILGGCTDASCPYFFGRLRAEDDEGNYIGEPDQQLLKVFNY